MGAPCQNGRTVLDHEDQALSSSLWARIKPHCPASFAGRRVVGPHPLLRVMRYDADGGFLPAHVDGTMSHAGNASFCTAFLYLNDVSGGETRFFRRA